MTTRSTTTATTASTVAIYGRQSLGKDSSIEQQLNLGQRRAATEGWTVHAVYSDGVSASRHGRTPRADWSKLLADVKAGRVGVIWLWESSRGDRRASTWLTLLEDCRDLGVRLYVETHARLYDMANPRDWRSLAEDGTDNEYESEKIRLRVSRSMQAKAERGEVHGRVAYGYRREYELTPAGKRVLVGQVPDPEQAPIVREMYQRLAAGESLRSVSKVLAERGVRNASGTPFSAAHIRDMVLRHVYAGLRAHSPTGPGHRAHTPVETVPGTWPALVSIETWQTVRSRLMDPARKTSRPGRATHPYSMIAVCDVCGGPMIVRYERVARGGEYTCRNGGHVRVGKADLEALVDVAIFEFLAKPDAFAQLGRDDAGERDAQLGQVRADLTLARADLDELRAEAAARRVSVATLVAVEPGLLAAVEDLDRQERELTTPPALAALIAPGDDIAVRWDATTMSAKREVARLLLTPDVIGQVRVTRAPSPGHRAPIEDRVTFARVS